MCMHGHGIQDTMAMHAPAHFDINILYIQLVAYAIQSSQLAASIHAQMFNFQHSSNSTDYQRFKITNTCAVRYTLAKLMP